MGGEGDNGGDGGGGGGEECGGSRSPLGPSESAAPWLLAEGLFPVLSPTSGPHNSVALAAP